MAGAVFYIAPSMLYIKQIPAKNLSLTTTTIAALSEEIPHHNKLLCVLCNSFTNNLEPCVCPLNISGDDLTFSFFLLLLSASPQQPSTPPIISCCLLGGYV